MHTFILILLSAALLLGSPGRTRAASILSPPPGTLYHGVYPGGQTGEEDDITPEDLQSYESTVGKGASWVYFSNNWYRSRHFPLETATWIREANSVPFIRLMLRDSPDLNKPNRLFTLDNILQGEFDDDLRAWARSAREFGTLLLVEFGTEANGNWFPWNGRYNGKGKLTGYGDPNRADGPERFRDAYRHIVTLMREEGADNIAWVFHANDTDCPDSDRRSASWNRMENYYPGDAYVDAIGVSVYGAQTPRQRDCPIFQESLDEAYPRLAALSSTKPLVLLEFGVTDHNRRVDQADWAKAALEALVQARWPRLIGFSWWNETWENDDNPKHDTDMRVQDNAELADVFKEWVGTDAKVLGTAPQAAP